MKEQMDGWQFQVGEREEGGEMAVPVDCIQSGTESSCGFWSSREFSDTWLLGMYIRWPADRLVGVTAIVVLGFPNYGLVCHLM